MQEYGKVGIHLAREEKEDPIYGEEYNYDSEAHPRSIILLRRSNGIPFPYLTNTLYDILTKGDSTDPFTRIPFSELTKSRIYLYKKAVELFPDIKLGDLDVKKIFSDWEKDCEEKKYTESVRIKAKAFLQVEDLLSLFQTFQGKGSMLNRQSAESYLKSNGKNWILRSSSMIDTEYDKGYTLTYKLFSESYDHVLIVHRIGEGFFYSIGATRGDPIPKQFSYSASYPSIIDLIENEVLLKT